MAPPTSFALGDYANLLSDAWKRAILTSTGRLSRKSVLEQYAKGRILPSAFLAEFNRAYPNADLPEPTIPDDQDGPLDTPYVENGERSPSINTGRKRPVGWLIDSWTRDDEDLNRRSTDGSLLPLTEHTRVMIENNVQVKLDGDIPESLLTREMLDHWSAVNDINGKAYYDPERFALGSLTRDEYMLIPSNEPITVCDVSDIGGGTSRYNPNIMVIAGIYALAKEQAEAMKMNEDDRIKWAALRVEAFKSGWFDHQKYTAFKPAPNNSMTIFVGDGKRATSAMDTAYTLCGFLPYLAEFYFRAYGSSYNQAGASEYVGKAQKLAAAISCSSMLSYMNQDLMYGKALLWIGVRRPMLALRNETASRLIPNIFRIRVSSSPAGQALITTSAAIIKALRTAAWWQSIAFVGNYDDSILMKAAEAIVSDPWKYHLMYFAYGVTGPNIDEVKMIEDAKTHAQMFAPILQAYIDTVTENEDLGRAKALKKHSMSNAALYLKATSVFKSVKRQKGRNVEEMFANTVFNITKPALEGNRT